MCQNHIFKLKKMQIFGQNKTKTDWNWRYTERHKYSKDDPKEKIGP